MRELKSIEEKILDRALYLIGKNRTSNISVRTIAGEAGVNVSAINYYFRTKEEMLRQAKELYIANTLSITTILENSEYELEERLIYAANEIMEYIIRYPGITVLLRDAKEREDETSLRILKVSDEMTDKLNLMLREVLEEDENYHYKCIIFWASVNYPVEDNGFSQYDSALLEDKEARMIYVKQLLAMLKQRIF